MPFAGKSHLEMRSKKVCWHLPLVWEPSGFDMRAAASRVGRRVKTVYSTNTHWNQGGPDLTAKAIAAEVRRVVGDLPNLWSHGPNMEAVRTTRRISPPTEGGLLDEMSNPCGFQQFPIQGADLGNVGAGAVNTPSAATPTGGSGSQGRVQVRWASPWATRWVC